MVKSLSDRIAARATKKAPSPNAQNRAVFLALRTDIKQALADGWPVKSIWETLHEEGKVTFSYQAFRGYVNRLIVRAPTDAPKAPPPMLQSAPPATTTTPTPSKPANPPGFTFNPVPNPKELL